MKRVRRPNSVRSAGIHGGFGVYRATQRSVAAVRKYGQGLYIDAQTIVGVVPDNDAHHGQTRAIPNVLKTSANLPYTHRNHRFHSTSKTLHAVAPSRCSTVTL